jgi:hypothetical protein
MDKKKEQSRYSKEKCIVIPYSLQLLEKTKNSKRKEGDEVRWKERGLFVYLFLLFLFSFFLHATLAMFLILNLT